MAEVMPTDRYVIFLTPRHKSFKPHIWAEGGDFTKEAAEYQARQIRKMKDVYEKVEVLPA